MDNHYKKYLKYKRKYLNQKYLQKGGGVGRDCTGQEAYDVNHPECVSNTILKFYYNTTIFEMRKPLELTNKEYFYNSFMKLMKERLPDLCNKIDKNNVIKFHEFRESRLGNLPIAVSDLFLSTTIATEFKISLIQYYTFNIKFDKDILLIEIDRNMTCKNLYLSILKKYLKNIDNFFTARPHTDTDKYSTYLFKNSLGSKLKIYIDDTPLTNIFSSGLFDDKYDISLESNKLSPATSSVDSSSTGVLKIISDMISRPTVSEEEDFYYFYKKNRYLFDKSADIRRLLSNESEISTNSDNELSISSIDTGDDIISI
jgi:hypothetical protein